MERNGTANLRNIIKKLDHDLIEVRERAVQNISSKLSNGIIFIEDLVHKEQIFLNLFKLLNRKENESEVLNLLQHLSQHEEGVRKIVKLGGIDYLTLLQHDMKESNELSNNVSSILDNIYRKSIHTENRIDESSISKGCAEMQQILFDYENEIQSTSEANNVNNVEQSKSSTLATSSIYNISQGPRNFHFHWISLTSSDRQVLAVTHKRLKSESPQLILQSCKFFCDVLLHDFPTEVFVQRPGICEAIVDSIIFYQNNQKELVMELLQSLFSLTKRLYKRCLQYKSKSALHCKDENVPSASMSTNVTETSNLSGESIVNKVNDNDVNFQRMEQAEDGELESSLITESLLQAQKSMEEVCLQILSTCLDVISVHLADNSMFILSIKVMLNILKLFKLFAFSNRWQNPDTQDNALIYHLISNIHRFDLVCEKVSKSIRLGDHNIEALILKRISIGRIILKLLKFTVPSDRIYEVVTDDLVMFLQELLLSSSVDCKLVKLKASLESVIAVTDEQFNTEYLKAKDILASMSCIDHFMELTTENKDTSIDIINTTCGKIFPSCKYYVYPGFVKKLWNYISMSYAVCKHKSKLEKLLLDMLTSVSTQGLCIIVQLMIETAQVSFSESLVTNPLSTKHQQSLIIFQKDVFSFLMTECLFHADTKIVEMMEHLISVSLKSSLHMSTVMWESIIKVISQHICFLQIAALSRNTDRSFSKSIFTLYSYPSSVMNVDGQAAGLLNIDVMKCVLRKLFSTTKRLRMQALGLMILRNSEYCVKENIPSNRRVICEDDRRNFSNIFVSTEKQNPLENSFAMNVSEENVSKLYKVMTDKKVSFSLRKAASEQLAVLFQDKEIQRFIGEKHPQEFCVRFLSQHVREDVCDSEEEDTSGYVHSILSILTQLCYHQQFIRNVISLQVEIFHDLFLLTFQYLHSDEIIYKIKCLLFLLLFNDLLTEDNSLQPTISTTLSACFHFPWEFPVKCNKTFDAKELKFDDSLTKYIKKYCHLNFNWSKDGIDDPIIVMKQEDVKEKNNWSYESLRSSISNKLHSFYYVPGDSSCVYVFEEMTLMCVSLFNECKKPRRNILNSLEDFMRCNTLNQLMQSITSDSRSALIFAKILDMIETCCDILKWDSLSLQSLADSLYALDIRIVIHSKEQMNSNSNYTSAMKKKLISFITNYSTSIKSCHLAVLITSLFKDLSETGSESYYDLPKMEAILESLMHLTSTPRWSSSLENAKEFAIEFFQWLSQILISFHVERIGASMTFMGKGIVKKALFCMCHILHEIQLIDKNMSWLESSPLDASDHSQLSAPSKSNLQWLVPLFSDRLTDIRWCGWALSTVFVSQEFSRNLVIVEFQNFPGGIWASCIAIILDEKECSLIRSQACLLLCELLSVQFCENERSSEQLWESMVVEDILTKNEVTGVEGFLLLLHHFDFYHHSKFFLANKSSTVKPAFKHVVDASTSVTPIHDELLMESTSIHESNTSTRQPSYGSMLVESEGVTRHFQHAFVRLLINMLKLPGDHVFTKLTEQEVFREMFSKCHHSEILEHSQNYSTSTSNIGNSKAVDLRRNELLLITGKVELLMHIVSNNIKIDFDVTSFVEFLFELFKLSSVVNEWREDLIKLWRYVAMLGRKLLISQKFTMVIGFLMNKEIFVSFIGVLLKLATVLKTLSLSILSSMLNFTLHVLKNIAIDKKWNIDEVIIEKKDFHECLFEEDEISGAEFLFEVLLQLETKVFDQSMLSLIRNCKASLFLVSKKSQMYALKNGVAESLIEEIKDVLVKLKLFQVIDVKIAKKKEAHHLSTLCDLINFMRNFALQNTNVKECLISCNCLVHLNNVWSWSNSSEKLKTSLLQLYVCLSARCRKAQCALTTSTLKISGEENHCCHTMVKLFSTTHDRIFSPVGKFDATLRIIFQFIINICELNEARNCFYKLNVLQLFAQIFTLKDCGNKHQRHVCKLLLPHWMTFLSVLSYYPDGAKAISKIPGVINLLQELLNQSKKTLNYYVILIFRNMLFVPSLKQLITSNNALIGMVFQNFCTPKRSIKTNLVTSSFCIILLADNLKAKSLLKKQNIQAIFENTVDDILSGKYLTTTEDFHTHEKLKENIKKVIDILKDE